MHLRALALLAAATVGGACAKPELAARPDLPPHPAAPAGVAHETWTFTARDGLVLFAQSWRPAGAPRGVLVVMHGLRDHGDRYAGFAGELAARGYAVYAFDLRGHGRSAGRRVTVGSFDDYLDDSDRFVASVQAREPGRPLFVFGHSMGGVIVTLWAETRRPPIAGVIVSAPAIRIDVPPIAAAVIFLSAALTPNLGVLADSNEGFSTDPAVTAGMAADPFIYQPGGPVATAAALVSAIERVWAGVGALEAPLLCLHGTADPLTSPAGSRELCGRAASRDRTLRLYPGQAHDLVHEPRRADVFADVVAWMDAHTGGAPASLAAAPDGPIEVSAPSLGVAFEGGYRQGDDVHLGGVGLRARAFFGARLAWPVGLDAEIFGGDVLTYRAAVYPVGVAWVDAAGHTVALGGGAGVSDAGAGAHFEIPISLDAELQLGAVRLLAWGRLSILPGEDPRGHAGVALRLGRDHRFWSTANAGTGPYLGVTLDRELGVTLVGAVIGVHLWGGS